MKPLVGNNVVDLSHPDNVARIQDHALLDRLFSDEEQQIIFSSADFLENVWILWSCKMTAKKIASKELGDFIFRSKEFKVQPIGGEYAPTVHTIYCRVTSPIGTIFTETQIRGKHLLTFGANDLKALQGIASQQLVIEEGADGSRELKRCFLQHLSEDLEINYEQLQLDKDAEGTPQLFIDGEQSDIQLSFSHDHDLAAFAYLIGN